MIAPEFLAGLDTDLERALEAAKIVVGFTRDYSWFLPWFIPDEYQSDLQLFAKYVAEAAGRVVVP